MSSESRYAECIKLPARDGGRLRLDSSCTRYVPLNKGVLDHSARYIAWHTGRVYEFLAIDLDLEADSLYVR